MKKLLLSLLLAAFIAPTINSSGIFGPTPKMQPTVDLYPNEFCFQDDCAFTPQLQPMTFSQVCFLEECYQVNTDGTIRY